MGSSHASATDRRVPRRWVGTLRGVTDGPAPSATNLAPPTGDRLALLRRMGFGELAHDSHVPLLSHLLGTRRVLASWGERAEMCDAGLFHSVYGTEYFEHDLPTDRDEVRAIIGPDAEAVAWAWCTIRRDTMDLTAPVTVVDRTTDERIELSDQRAADIATLWAADTVEQIARMDVHERTFAHSLLGVLHLARPAAREATEAILHLIEER